MSTTGKYLALGSAVLLGATGLVLLIFGLSVDPPPKDLAALTAFLLGSGGATILLARLAARWGFPGVLASLQAKLVVIAVFLAALALLNVGVTAFLMFLSGHDLALLGALLMFSLVISVFVAFTISEPPVRSIREVVEGLQKINAGSLNTRVPVYSQGEVGELAHALNTMTERLETSFNRERELERARRDLAAAISHDLRTPLASIRAMIEGINDGVVTAPATVDRYLQTIQTEAENLSQLINDLFDLSQLEAGVLELHLEAASLGDLISDTLASMTAQAEAGHVKLQGTADSELPLVMMDAPRMQRVLYNLVQNSIRYTPPDGTVHIEAKDAGRAVQIEVIDSGEGIPAGDLPHVFERFYRADQSRSRESGGSGLGLSIAKMIVEAHGGDIWATSDEREGSAFGFTVPKVSAG